MFLQTLNLVCPPRRALAVPFVMAICVLLGSAPRVEAQQSWDGGGSATNLNWSNLLNWSSDLTPEAKAITFNSTGLATAGTTTSIVDQSYSITSLTFDFSSATGQGHTMQINSGATLTQTAGTTIGGALVTSGVTNLKVTGDGSWVVNAPSATFSVGNTVASRPLILDMSGLATFNANVTNFYIGSGGVQTLATVDLARSSTVTATLIRMGASGDTGTTTGSVVRLGQSTTFNATDIVIATGRTSMTVGFQSSTVNPTFTIAGKTTGTRANLTLGGSGTGTLMAGGSSSPNGIMDLRGGTLNFSLGNFVLGNAGGANATSGGIGYGLATFSFNAGTIDVTNLYVARTQNITTVTVPGGNADAVHATFNMEGGSMTVANFSIAENQDGAAGVNGNSKGVFNLSGGSINATGNVTMGSHTSDSTGYADATLKLTGGTLTVVGNLTEGTTGDNRSKLELMGGTLDMTDGYINVDTFTAESGMLKNVAEIYNGLMTATFLAKNGTGTLILDGTNSYTGGTYVNAGTLQVGAGGTSGTSGSSFIEFIGNTTTLAYNRSDTFVVSNSLVSFDGNLRKDGTGTMLINQANTNMNQVNVAVNTGTLRLSHASALGINAKVTVAAAGKFGFVTPTTTGGTLSLAALTTQAGSSLELGFGDRIAVANGGYTGAGAVTINVLAKAGLSPSGVYTLLTGNNLSSSTYNFQFYGLTDAILNSVTSNASTVQIEMLNGAGQLPTELYWKGGYAGLETTWAVSNGQTQSNWAADRGGDSVVGIVPGEETNVIFAVNSANTTYMQNTVLGYDMRIKSLSVDGQASGSAGTSAVVVNDDGHLLTIVGGNATTSLPSIYVAHTAGALSLHSDVNLAAVAPLITTGMTDGTQLGLGTLTISGILSGNGFTKRGAGVMNLTGSEGNTFTGITRIEQGTLNLGKTAGLNAISGSELIIGEAVPSVGTLRATVGLNANEQIANTTDVTIYAGNTLDLKGRTETIGGLTGAGTVTNSVAGTSIFAVGAGDESTTFSGVITNGATTSTMIVGLHKLGTGTFTLSGNNNYTGVTAIANGTLKLGTNQTLGGSQLQFGNTNTTTTASLLDLTTASGTFGSLVAQTNSTTNGGQVIIGAGQTLNINGGVRIGSSAGALATTLFTVSGTGTMNITNAASGATVAFGGYAGSTGGQGNNVVADFRDLETLNISLNTTNGEVRVNNASDAGTNVKSEFYTAKNTTITAKTLTIGGRGQYAGGSDSTNAVFLGTGRTLLNVDAINLGTGSREFGKLAFQGAEGTLVIRGTDGVSRAALIVGGGSGNTGTSSANNVNDFDVRGHEVDLYLGTVQVGTQAARATNYKSYLSFDQGKMDMQSLILGTRTNLNNTNGTSEPRSTDAEFNIGGGTVNIVDGITSMAVVTKIASGTEDTTRIHTVNSTMNIGGGAKVTIGQTGGVAIRMAGSEVTNSLTNAVINLTTNAEVSVLGDIVKVGGAGTANATINLNGGILDMNGHLVGSATNTINFNAEAGVLRNLGNLNGGGNLVKTTSGTLALQGLNTYTGRTMVNAGTVIASTTNNLRDSAGVTVASGGVFHFASATGGNNIVLKDLVLQGGSTIGVSVGNLIDVQGNASATGSVTVDFYGVPGLPAAAGTYSLDVITALTGTLNGATYTMGNYYNATNFTVNSVGSTATSVFLNLTVVGAGAIPAEVWWKGGYGSGLGNVWAVSNGSTLSNWVTNQAGLPEHNTSLVPGATTTIHFSAAGAQNRESMRLGASMSVGSLEFEDTASPIVLDDQQYILSINSQGAISLAAGSQNVALNTTVNLLHTAPEVDTAASTRLDLSWILSGNAWAKLGTGVLRLSGNNANTYTGTAQVLAGEVELAKSPGVNAITGSLVVGEVGGSGTVRVRLFAADQIADTSVVTLNTNGVLTLNGYNETIAGLQGTGAVENLADSTVSVLTVGAGDASSTFNGVLRNGGALPTLELNKIGTGTLTLGGAAANTNAGTTRVYGGVLALNKNEGVDAVRWDLIVGDGVDTDTVRWLASNQVGFESNVTVNVGGVLDLNGFVDTVRTVTLDGGQITGLAGSALGVTNGFAFRGGVVDVSLIGTGGLTKTTTGDVRINGQGTYSGTTAINAGSITTGVDNALPTGTVVTLGEGAAAGKLDLTGFNQTIAGLNVSNTNEANVNEIVVSAGKTLTVNGNIQVGPTASASAFNNATTRLNVTGGGNMVMNSNGGIIRVAAASGTNIATKAIMDLSALNSFTANLGATGAIHVGQGDNQSTNRDSSIILAQNNDITVGTINIGGGDSGATQSMILGGGTNVLRVNTLNIGTGGRDRGTVAFAGAGGTISISGVTSGTRTAFNLATSGATTGGTGVTNIFDVSGHTANLLLSDVNIGTQARGNTTSAVFSFSAGTLDMNTLNMAIRGVNTSGNGGATPRDTIVTMNLSGGATVIQQGIIGMARVTGATVSGQDVGKARIANATLNVTGTAQVEVKAATGGTAISMAGAAQATNGASSSSATAVINILDASVLTVRGNIVREGGPGTTSATINLDGGTLDMAGNAIGTAVSKINVLNFASGTLKNLAQINGGDALVKSSASKTLKLEGANTYTGGTTVSAGTLLVNGTNSGGAAFSVASGATLGGSGFITPASGQSVVVNGRLAVGDSTLATPQAGTLTVTTTGSGALVFNTGSSLEFDLINAGSGAINSSDLLDINGQLTLGSGVTLDVGNPNGIANWAFGDTWKLIDWNGMTFTGGSQQTFTLGASFATVLQGTGYQWDFTQLYTEGVVSIAPEPGRFVLLLLGGMGLLLRRRRSATAA